LSVELVIILVLFVISLLGFVYITNNVFRLRNTNFDQQVFQSVLPYVNEANTSILLLFTFLGSQDFLLPANIVLALYFLFIRKHRWYSIRVPVVSLGSFAVMSSLKIFFQRPRPLDPVYEAARGFSFPSGHSMSAMTFFGLLIFIVWDMTENKTLRWSLSILLTLVILAIGFSRVYLRVHYASDVLAGFALGLIWLVISLWTIGKLEKYTKKEIAPVVNDNKD
jgi:membrane-associated phospholipid phosphatase